MPNTENTGSDVWLSVIIPTRDRPEDFSRALASVIAQTFKGLEVLAVIDGSSSENLEAYKRIEQGLPPFVTFRYLMHRSNGHGHCFARNHGVEHARGAFIAFLDDDDLWIDNGFIARAREALANEGASFYMANQEAIAPAGQIIPNVWLDEIKSRLPVLDPRQEKEIFPLTVAELLRSGNFSHMNTWILSKKLFVSAGGMYESLRYEPDRDVYLRLLDKTDKVIFDTAYVARHHVPDKSKKKNASTAGSEFDRLLFQLHSADRIGLNCSNPLIRDYCKERKAYILRRISEQCLAMPDKKALALHFSMMALSCKATLKWVAFCALLSLRLHGKALKLIQVSQKGA